MLDWGDRGDRTREVAERASQRAESSLLFPSLRTGLREGRVVFLEKQVEPSVPLGSFTGAAASCIIGVVGDTVRRAAAV